VTAPFQALSNTSHAAAVSVEPRLSALQAKCLAAYHAARENTRCPNGLTDQELSAATGLSGSTARPRRIELVRLGLVKDAGWNRKTASGRWAVVYVAT
jgi:hypothetical protein